MFLKLNNNPKLANPITGTIVDNIALTVDKLFIRNCPLVDGYANLKKIYDVQSDNGSIVLSRVRVDIGNVSGPLSELMQYSSMAGFNDAGEEQAKPRLVGTWTVNDWYTQEQVATAQAAFDGLTVVGDSNYLINFDDLAVQCLDDTKPNYNPAVAIVLQSHNIGITLNKPPADGGRWFITKNDASLINVSILFEAKVDVVDANKIVSDDETLSYPFVSFNEFQYFTTVNNTAKYGNYNITFYNCTKLEQITLPQTLTSIISRYDNFGGFTGCTSLKQIDLSNITYLYMCFVNCTELEDVIFGNITSINGAFLGCIKLKLRELPTSLTSISGKAFQGVGSNLTLTPDDLIDVNLPNLTNSLGPAFHGCTLIKRVLNLGNITRLQKDMYYTGTFSKCPNLEFIELPSTLTTIDEFSFTTHIPSRTGLKENAIIHLKSVTPPSFGHKQIWPNSVKIYVGDGSSATNDDTILQAYLADTNWSTFSSRLDTWYNYLHPTT